MSIVEKVMAAAPRITLPAPSSAPVVDRRMSMRLCASHWSKLEAQLCGSGIVGATALLETARDAVVGQAAFLAGEHASELADNGCPLCFLVERSTNPWAGVEVYDLLIEIAARHVLESAS